MYLISKKTPKILLCFIVALSVFTIKDGSISYSESNGEREKKVIFFIPGLMGSELFEDEALTDLIWIDILELRKIKYETKLYPGYPLGWPGSKKFEHIPQWKWMGTKTLDDDLNYYGEFYDYFSNKDNYSLYYFSYDWSVTVK